jgi:ABC-type nitrate/sulfonate/bicarbonate transport system substrate-binding protein
MNRAGVGRGLSLALVAASVAGVVGLAAGGPLGRPVAAQGTKGGLTPIRLITFTPGVVLSVAQARGFFAAQGLQVEHTLTSSSQQLMQGVIDGTYDIAFTNPDNWIVYVTRDNADVFMFAGNVTGSERTLVARPEIQSVDDLRGKDIAVDAVDSGFVLILWRILADQGIDFRGGDPRLVAVGATALRLQSMERGETVAAILTSPETEQALALGYRVLGRSMDHLPQYPAPQSGTSRRWAAAHQDELVRFIRAYVAATDWTLDPANREAALALHRDAWNVTREAAEAEYAAIQPAATINTAGIQTILDLRAELGFLTPPIPPATRFYDVRYWEAATGRRHP